MASLNKVILIGYMVADPELKQTGGGVQVCSFRIGVGRKMSKENVSDFIDIVAWRQAAEFVSRYFKKGQPIQVVGSLQGRGWEDKTGQKRYALEVVAEELGFVEKQAGGESAAHKPMKPEEKAKPEYYSQNAGGGFGEKTGAFEDLAPDEDLPF